VHAASRRYLYDVTSTYFEGQAEANPKAKLGHSRDKRADCKQVLIRLALGREGFPLGHEIFAGNRQDRSTLGDRTPRDLSPARPPRTDHRPGSKLVRKPGVVTKNQAKYLKCLNSAPQN
jgi:hypothetical protein